MQRRFEESETRVAAQLVGMKNLETRVRHLEDECDRLRFERDAVLSSTSWRLTSPARALFDLVPSGIKRLLRSSARVVDRLLTSQWSRRYIPQLRLERQLSSAPPAVGAACSFLGRSSNVSSTLIPVTDRADASETTPGTLVDLDQLRADIQLTNSTSICIDRPVGIFVHIFYEDLAESLAKYLACIDLPMAIYISTGTTEQRDFIFQVFERYRLAAVTQIEVVPNSGFDVAPLLIRFRDKLLCHDICLKVHCKKSASNTLLGTRWRRYLYNELIGDTQRARAVVNGMVADADLGVVMAAHYYGISGHTGIGPNYELMRRVLANIGVDLRRDQRIEFPSGSMFWFRSDVIVPLTHMGFDWVDFEPRRRSTDGTLAHAIERSILFSCASVGKRWAILPPYHSLGPSISREEVVRLIRASGEFDEAYYKATYSDVRHAQVDPIEHWVDVGCRRSYAPSDPRFSSGRMIYDLLELHMRGVPLPAVPDDPA